MKKILPLILIFFSEKIYAEDSCRIFLNKEYILTVKKMPVLGLRFINDSTCSIKSMSGNQKRISYYKYTLSSNYIDFYPIKEGLMAKRTPSSAGTDETVQKNGSSYGVNFNNRVGKLDCSPTPSIIICDYIFQLE